MQNPKSRQICWFLKSKTISWMWSTDLPSPGKRQRASSFLATYPRSPDHLCVAVQNTAISLVFFVRFLLRCSWTIPCERVICQWWLVACSTCEDAVACPGYLSACITENSCLTCTQRSLPGCLALAWIVPSSERVAHLDVSRKFASSLLKIRLQYRYTNSEKCPALHDGVAIWELVRLWLTLWDPVVKWMVPSTRLS